MAKKVTLASLAQQMQKGFALIEKRFAAADTRFTDVETKIEKGLGSVDLKFAALADDIARIDGRLDGMATKDQVIALHTQVNSIETQLRDMRHVKLHARVADLEEKIFGEAL